MSKVIRMNRWFDGLDPYHQDSNMPIIRKQLTCYFRSSCHNERERRAHALARLDTIPAAAIPLLVECTLDADDGLRTNAAMALSLAPAGMVAEVMQRLVAVSSSRVRLIAASSLLSAESSNPSPGAVLREALEDPALHRAAAHDLLESPGLRVRLKRGVHR